MGDVIDMIPRGEGLDTLVAAAEVVAEHPEYRVYVILQGEDATDLRVSYSEGCNPSDAHYAFSWAANIQLGLDDD